MKNPKSLTGTIHLPDARLSFYLSFDGKGGKDDSEDDETRLLGSILDQAVNLPPEMQELLIKFADTIREVAEKCGQGHKA